MNENGEVGSLHRLADITNVELPDEPEDMNAENYRRFVSENKTFSCELMIYPGPVALYYFFYYGNDLYLRFPKKLRRKKGWKRR